MEKNQESHIISYNSSLIRCIPFSSFFVVNLIRLLGILEDIGNGCLNIFYDFWQMCCGIIGIVGTVFVVIVALFFRKKKWRKYAEK